MIKECKTRSDDEKSDPPKKFGEGRGNHPFHNPLVKPDDISLMASGPTRRNLMIKLAAYVSILDVPNGC